MTPLTIALAVQTCTVGQYGDNLDSSLGLIRQAAGQGADMVVFPEMNLTGYASGDRIEPRPVDPDLVRCFKQTTDRYGIAVLVGLAEKVNKGTVYATHLVFMPGKAHGSYRKIHTAPNEQDTFSAGNDCPLFEHQGVRFGIQLCYDAHFPELTTAMALKGADLVILPHASPRGTSRDKYDSWMRHLSARAFDNSVFIAAVNQTGDNGAALSFPGLAVVIGPDGKLISKSLENREHLHMETLDPDLLAHVRTHRMRYFLPNRRNDLFPL